MEKDLVEEEIKSSFSKTISLQEANEKSPINLAYIGDAVYEIYIRKYTLLHFRGKVNEINKKTISFVKATSQSHVMNSIMGELDEDEIRIVKRGRNQSPKTIPKNTDLRDYKMATGFEALLGYLYLTGHIERLEAIIARTINITLNSK